jgi:transportin-3
VYREFHHSCFLYLGSVVVDEFGELALFQDGLMVFLQALAEVALPLLSGEAGLVDNPDTVDDLFRLCSR